jgi:hypothetical protein
MGPSNASSAPAEDTAPNRNLSVGAAAQYLNVSESFLNKLRGVSSAGPAFFKIGARIVYSIRELDAWLAARRRTSTADTGKAA